MAVSNAQFAKAVNAHYTMASRLRNGQRMPSVSMLNRIIEAYHLDAAETLAAYAAGPAQFGRYLREQVFEKEPVAA